MFYAALFFAAGVVFAQWSSVPSGEWLLLIGVLLVAALIGIARGFKSALLLALLACVALGAMDAQLANRAQPSAPDISAYTAESMEITAHVTATALPRTSQEDKSLQTIEAETETISDGSDARPFVVGARLTLHENGRPLPVLRYGDRIRFVAKLREPRNYGNPGAMDYRGYLAGKGIYAIASVPTTSIELLPGKSGSRFGFLRARMRDSFLDHMLSLTQEPCARSTCMSREDVGVLAAMIIGEQSLLERSTKIDFQKTGAFHILVVSGMNVGIVAFVLFWLGRRLHLHEYATTAATIVLSLLYAYLTDMGAPILRAALMLSLYLAARLIYRDRYSLNSIGTAALILLVAHPASLFDASFQLTFLSVVALGGIVQPLLERTIAPYVTATRHIDNAGYDAALEPTLAQFRLDLRMIAQRIGLFVPRAMRAYVARTLTVAIRGGLAFASLVIVTATLQVALALPMVWYFHRLALTGVPVNIVIVPLTSALMPVGILAALAAYLFTPLAKLLAIASAVLLHAIMATVTTLAALPRADVRLPMPTVAIAVLCGLTFGLALFAFKRSRRWALAGCVALVLNAAWLTMPRAPEIRADAAELTAIDVGQGDSLLVLSPHGHAVLIDGGGPPGFARPNSFDVGEDVVSPYLWARGFSHLDAVVLTHPHSDHMDGLRAIIRNFRPRELWLAEDLATPQVLAAAATDAGTNVRRIHSAEDVELDGLRFTAHLTHTPKTVNDDSLVLRLEYNGTSALLLGDAERALETEVAHDEHPVDILKVAHHGSATSTTPELLTATHPKFAVISVGAHNNYGHPRREVLDRLNAAHAQTYRTDEDGATTFVMNGKTVAVETFLTSAGPRPQPAGSRDSPR
jgi:competence protein ComEC